MSVCLSLTLFTSAWRHNPSIPLLPWHPNPRRKHFKDMKDTFQCSYSRNIFLFFLSEVDTRGGEKMNKSLLCSLFSSVFMPSFSIHSLFQIFPWPPEEVCGNGMRWWGCEDHNLIALREQRCVTHVLIFDRRNIFRNARVTYVLPHLEHRERDGALKVRFCPHLVSS